MSITLLELLGLDSLELLDVKSSLQATIPQVLSGVLGPSALTSLESEMQALRANDAATPKEAAIVAFALLDNVAFPRTFFFSIFIK
jgi:hypothetical protein